MGKLVDKLKTYLESPEGIKDLEEWAKKKNKESEIRDKQIERLYKLSIIDRSKFIEKCIDKYSSDKYKDKEMFKCGYQPREDLFYLLFDYSEKYGECIDISNLDESFLAGRYIIDSKYEISLYIGQGSFIAINLIK